MSEELFSRFRALVLQDLTVAAIRTSLGDALASYSDQELVSLMLTILS